MIIKGAFMLFTLFALSSDVGLSVLSQGLTKTSPFQNVVRNKEELKKVWGKLGIVDEIPAIDFKKELVIILVPGRKIGGSVEISGVERKAKEVEVRFVLKPSTVASKTYSVQLFPYLVAK